MGFRKLDSYVKEILVGLIKDILNNLSDKVLYLPVRPFLRLTS